MASDFAENAFKSRNSLLIKHNAKKNGAIWGEKGHFSAPFRGLAGSIGGVGVDDAADLFGGEGPLAAKLGVGGAGGDRGVAERGGDPGTGGSGNGRYLPGGSAQGGGEQPRTAPNFTKVYTPTRA